MRQSQDAYEAIERRRTVLRTILFLVILGTVPFYLLGFWLWGTAPATDAPIFTATSNFTNTPLGADSTPTDVLPTLTPRPTNTPLGPLNPTPIINPIIPTRFLSPTPTVFIPPPTLAPTFTPFVPTDPPPPTAVPTQEDTAPLPPFLLTASAQPEEPGGFVTATPLIPPSDTPQP